MAGAIILRNRFSDLFFSRLAMLHKIMFEEYEAPGITYDQVFNVQNSVRAFEETTGVTGFGEFVETAEGEPIDYDTIYQAGDKRFTHVKFAKGFQISMEAQMDDIDAVISRAAPALGRAARNSTEKYIWQVFNNAFTSELTPDGVSLCNANHTIFGPEALLFNNTVAGDLAVGTLESGINKFNDMIDDRGLLIEVNPAKLVYNDALQWTVHELLQSQLRPDTTDNASNPVGNNRLGLGTVMTRYLLDEDAWFLVAPPSQHQVMVFWRMQPSSDFGMDFDTGNAKTKMVYRLSRGAADWRGIVGSAGL